MALDLLRRGKMCFPRNKTGSGATNINNGVIQIELEKAWLVEEHVVRVQVSQGFTGVPTSFDIRRFFSKVQLLVDHGEGMKMNFHAAYDLARVTENVPAPIVALAATSTADFTFDIHHANDGAIGELVSSVLSGKYSTLTLELTINPDANNGFIGGTVPLVATYSVEVMPLQMRVQTPTDRGNTGEGWGIVEHIYKQQANLSGGVAGGEFDMKLTSGGLNRFIILHAFDAASFGNLTDAVYLNGARISLEVDGFKYFENTALSTIKQRNFVMRNISSTGVVVLDFGDDPQGWCDLRHVKEPVIKLSIPASASLPAAWRLEYCQDYSKGMELLEGALNA